jgi:hypothetical protein
VALQEKEAKVEEFLAERSASIDWIVSWVDEVNPSLDALGLNPIQVTEAHPHSASCSQCWTPPPSVFDTWRPPSSISWRQMDGRSPEGWRSTFLPTSEATTPPAH